MSRKVLGAAALLVGALSIGSTAMAQDRGDWPASFTVGTASQGGTYYTYGSGWANYVAETLGVSGGGQVTGGPVQNAALVQTGDLEFGMVTMGPAFEAWNGNSELAPGLKHDELRAMFPMYQTPFSIAALTSSDIASVADMSDGLKVGVGPAGGTSDAYFQRFFDTLGVDIEKRNGGASDLAGQLQDGLIDVMAFAAGIPVSAYSQLEAQTDVNLFAFTEAEVQKLVDAFPVSSFTIPGGTYSSVSEPMHSVAMWNFAVARSDMSESFVYEIVKLIMENNDRMMQIHRAARETLPENYIHNSFLPWHPGAVRWFEENGFMVPDNLKG
ncbi:MAG: TAXI family TRAP transporter solute-binding subunit [Inquilinus sp.]|nr:TAXI family TRAP transporter solute-binding subunit [Inquilinus sp.]